ncbi:MAG: S-layer homology domain-containing protein, partial [Moorella sp. (in: Bacteria)]|nr:S-layer homology domain-containing protein [Moorella sp. (in: firmicutes)]
MEEPGPPEAPPVAQEPLVPAPGAGPAPRNGDYGNLPPAEEKAGDNPAGEKSAHTSPSRKSTADPPGYGEWYEPLARSPEETEFVDVPPAHWARPAIEFLAKKGILTGVIQGRFYPHKPLQRAELALLLDRALPGMPASPTFTWADVPSTSRYAGAIARVTAAGIMEGYGGKYFCPAAGLSRENAVLALARAAEWLANSGESKTLTDRLPGRRQVSRSEKENEKDKLLSFRDYKSITPAAQKAFSWAVKEGLVHGY